MARELRVLIEEPPKGKRWVAIAADWPGFERNGKSADDAVAKLTTSVSNGSVATLNQLNDRDSLADARQAGV